VIALDVVRALKREPEAVKALLREFELCFGSDSRLDGWMTRLKAEIAMAEATHLASPFEMRARRVVDQMALGLQASLLVRFGDPTVAEAFLASRLNHGG
jgi:putative acyl-CoA dehydrogenase